jgi:hypothetical protein
MIQHLDAHDLRVLVFAPVGRDAVLTRDLLARASDRRRGLPDDGGAG